MFQITEIENSDKKKSPLKDKNPFYIKGLIHITDSEGGFEALQEEFFYNGLEPNGEFMSQDDFCVRMDYDLKDFDWGIEVKEGEVYGVLWNFNIIHSKSWTSCGYEYDSDIETNTLEFSLLDEEHTKWLFEEDTFQFEE